MSTTNIPSPKLAARTEKRHHDRQPLRAAEVENSSTGIYSGSVPLAEKVAAALAQHSFFRCQPPAVRAEAGHITLRGVVATYYHKQMAQETIRRLDGVDSIDNLLHVSW